MGNGGPILAHTVTYDVPILVFGHLEERGPGRIILKIEAESIGFGERVKVALGQLVEVVRSKLSKVGHDARLIPYVSYECQMVSNQHCEGARQHGLVCR